MDAMYSAIKGRRGGLLNDVEENAGQEMPEPQTKQGGDLKGLVTSLSDDQKMQLLGILMKDQGMGSAKVEIEKGASGPGEDAELAHEVEDLGGDHESEDEIAESMLSSADKMRAEQGARPRNLSDRMKMGLASKLKKKG